MLRPPLTVLATRLTATSFSLNSLACSYALHSQFISSLLEVQTALASAVCKLGYATGVDVATAVEDDFVDALFHGALGDELADQLGSALLVELLSLT